MHLRGSYNYILFFILLSLSCGKTDRVDTRGVKKVLKEREIKRLTDSDITEYGIKVGNLNSKSIINCQNTGTLNLIECLGADYKELIKTIKIYPQDSAQLSKAEREILEAYIFNAASQEKAQPNLQDLKNEEILYSELFYYYNNKMFLTKPILKDTMANMGVIFITYDKRKLIISI